MVAKLDALCWLPCYVLWAPYIVFMTWKRAEWER